MTNVGMVIDPTHSEPQVINEKDEVCKDVNIITMCSKQEEFGNSIMLKVDGVSPPGENGLHSLSPLPKLEDDNIKKKDLTGERIVNEETCKNCEQQALQDVGNFGVPTSVIAPRKSLLKRPKSESLNSSVTSNPPKRIRIVENLDTVNSNNYIQLNDGSESPDAFEGADELATVNEEVSSCGETIRWLSSPSTSIDQSSINVEFVRDNLSPIKRTFSAEIDMRFILTETCTAILGCKSAIAGIGSSNFHLWISQHSMHTSPILKPMAYKENYLKLANVDAVLNYDLTSPKELTNDTASSNENVYYVGDLWQNSKGFREYLLHQTSTGEKEFSTKILTMRTAGPSTGEVGFKQNAGLLLSEVSASSDEIDLAHLSTENVEAYGSCSDPLNILDVTNINNFVNFVNSRTNGKGLHAFVVDNAEVSYVYESCREIRLQKYLYCECLLALRCLREGGTFVCKIFDTFTLFTNGLLFLLYKCFKHIAIHKPSSSSSRTSERFIICKEKIDNSDSKYVIDFLSDCLDMVVNNQETRKIVRRKVRKRLTVVKMEVQRIVPLRLILSHDEFFQFVRESNIRLTSKLAESINELCKLMKRKDRTRLNHHIDQLKQDHASKISLLKLPAACSSNVKLSDPLKQVEAFMAEHGISEELLSNKDLKLDEESHLGCPDVLVFPVQMSLTGSVFNSKYGWFYGCSGSKILHFCNNAWIQLECSEFSLPRGTLLLGEITEEIHIAAGVRRFTRCFHIFDGSFIRGSYIGPHPFKTRQAIVTRFITSIKNLSTNAHYVVVPPLESNQLATYYLSTKFSSVVGYNRPVRHCEREDRDSETKKLMLVNGFLIIKNLNDVSPPSLFQRFKQLNLMWKQEDMQSCLSNLESWLNPLVSEKRNSTM